MNIQTLLIYQYSSLYEILKEIENKLNFKIINAINQKSLNYELNNLDNYLIITKNKISNIENQYIVNQLPIKLFKLIEKFNVELLKQQFNDQSQININNYNINLNSREMLSQKTKLKLTEKEINTILYLSKASTSVSIEELESNVWGYQSDIETHTVETHIYRLRKKILNTFKDSNFILSKKNGYQIK